MSFLKAINTTKGQSGLRLKGRILMSTFVETPVENILMPTPVETRIVPGRMNESQLKVVRGT